MLSSLDRRILFTDVRYLEREQIMDRATIAFTAVYLKAAHGYVGFVEELPGVNSQGRTIDEARVNLQRLAKIVFDEERAQAEELLRGKEVVREDFVIPLRSRVRAQA